MDDTSGPLQTLEQFPNIPCDGLITIAESHSELHAIQSTSANPATAKGFCPLILGYNAVDGHHLAARLPFKIPTIRTSVNRKSIILERREGIPKTLWDSWWEEGIKGVHQCLVSAESSSDMGNMTRIIVKAATGITSICVKLYESPSNFLTFLFPHLEWKVEDVNDEFSRVRRWKESWIRAIAWHPTAPYLALALNDDSVRCSLVGNDIVPMLRCQEQRNVSCVAWRSQVTTELAVGCEDCIVIWQLRSSVAASMKAAKDKSIILKVNGHAPISCVEYSRDGYYLLSSSAKDSSVYIWDAFTFKKTPLKRIGGGGIPLATWAPTASKILTASPTNVFWIWRQSELWECKRWTTPESMIEAGCWNPSGSVLLFATGGFIYGIFFELSPVDSFISQADAVVKRVYDIRECHVFDSDGKLGYKVGGKVRQMDWDDSGHRLAVMFDDSDMVAVFRVLHPTRSEYLTPLGYIRGHSDESPSAIAFQKDFKDGALLTIAWNSGRIQYFPMIFALPSNSRNMMHEDNYRMQHVVQGHPSLFSAAGFVSPKLSVSGAEAANQSFSELVNQQEDVTSPSRLFSVSRNS